MKLLLIKNYLTLIVLLSGVAFAQFKVDHLVFTTPDLDQTQQTLDSLGFTIKPGRVHPNGIKNFFIKFGSGSYLEFIQVIQPKDPLAEFYKRHTDFSGVKPVFISFGIDKNTLDSLAGFYTRTNIKHSVNNTGYANILSFPLTENYIPYFFISYTRLPDDSAYINHKNGALLIESLRVGVTIDEITNCIENFKFFKSNSGTLIDEISIRVKNIEQAFDSRNNVSIRQPQSNMGVICTIDNNLEIIFRE